MTSVFSDFKRSFLEEARTTVGTPLLWLTGIVVPIFWCLVLVGVFATGMLRDIPVGLVDYDNSVESRELVRTLEAVPSIGFVGYESPQAAASDLASGRIYALFVIRPEWSEKSAAGRQDSALELFLNKNYYTIATTVETDIKTMLARLQIDKLLVQGAATGGGFKGSKTRLDVLKTDVLIAGNPALNFKAYLLTTLIPGVLALAAILTGIGAVTREWRQGKIADFAREHPCPRSWMLGRLAFWLVVYSLMGLAYLAWFAGWEGWGVAGSLAAWAAGVVLLMAAMFSLALLYATLAPSWILAMSVGIGTTAPIFPFTGFSFPLESMDSAAQLFANFLPLTWYLRLHSTQWVLGSDLPHTLFLLAMLALFVTVPAAAALSVLPGRIRSAAQKAMLQAPEKSVDEPVGFFACVREVFVRAALTRDTFIIFFIAVAFYLLFYAWPYSAQNVTNVTTAVVDLDQSPASRALIDRLRSVSYFDVVAVDNSRAVGQDLYKTEKASAVITIDANFEENLLAGKPAGISLTANGAFPVKARAVSAGLLGVVSESMAASSAYNLVRAGAPLATIKKLEIAPVSLAAVNQFNPLSGYASYIVSAVMPVIIQAVMLVSIGMSLGGWLAKSSAPGVLRAVLRSSSGFAALFAAFWLFSLVWLAYAIGPAFAFLDFTSMQNPIGTLVSAGLFAAAIVGFGLTFTLAMGTNAYCAQFFVVISAPALFVSGLVHPIFDMTPGVLALRLLLPSTPGITALVAVSQNGAPLSSVAGEILHLTLLIVLYAAAAYLLWRKSARRLGFQSPATKEPST